MEAKQLVVRNRLKELMAKRDIPSVTALSRETGLFYLTLLSFYHGKSNMFNTQLVTTLCSYFECGISDLLYIDERRE